MSEELIGDNERQKQQLESNAESPEVAQTSHADVTEATSHVQEAGVIEVPDEPQVDDVEAEVEVAPVRSFEDVLRESIPAGTLVRFNLTSALNFVLEVRNDGVQSVLEDSPHYVLNDQTFNVIQPLSKLNPKSHRVGVLREPLNEFIECVGAGLGSPINIVVDSRNCTDCIEPLAREFIRGAEAILYKNFEVNEEGEPVINFGGDVEPLPAHALVRTSTFMELAAIDSDDDSEVTTVDAVIHFFVTLRVPVLLRGPADKAEKNLINHVRYLERVANSADMVSTVYASFGSPDLVNENVFSLFSTIRELDGNCSILARSNIEEASEFLGIYGFDGYTIGANLFNGDDFLVAFNVENQKSDV